MTLADIRTPDLVLSYGLEVLLSSATISKPHYNFMLLMRTLILRTSTVPDFLARFIS